MWAPSSLQRSPLCSVRSHWSCSGISFSRISSIAAKTFAADLDRSRLRIRRSCSRFRPRTLAPLAPQQLIDISHLTELRNQKNVLSVSYKTIAYWPEYAITLRRCHRNSLQKPFSSSHREVGRCKHRTCVLTRSAIRAEFKLQQ